MTRKQIFFSGRVQGVGFRYTTLRISRSFQVKGFVRNLPNGKVELVAEGLSDQIDEFVAEINLAMERNIDHVDVHTTKPLGEFDDFSIR